MNPPTSTLNAKNYQPGRALFFNLGLGLLLAALSSIPSVTTAEENKTAWASGFSEELTRAVPKNVEDLRAIQKQVRTVLTKVMPCTVNLRVGRGQGSGVIISADGYVLTAGHVSRDADKEVNLTLPDGRKLKAKTLGSNRDLDSGLIKITQPGPWPFVPMGHSGELQKGQWCLTIGHPGGYQPGRTPVVRLGRILEVNDKIIRSDCPLVGGDSGGPLFDLEGRVIGIHSRIGESMTANIHVPVDTYKDTWERLVGGEVWGSTFPGGKPNGAYLGFRAHPDSKECRVVEVFPGSPAEKGGLKVDDVITRFGEHRIDTFEDLRNQLDKMKPGQEVGIEVQRDGEVVIMKFVLGKRD